MENCIDLPLRSMTVKALELTYQTAPKMTEALRSREGMSAYNERFKTYLDEEVRSLSALRGFYQKSMIARMLYADLRNHKGTGRRINELIDEIVPPSDDLSTCLAISRAEDKILIA